MNIYIEIRPASDNGLMEIIRKVVNMLTADQTPDINVQEQDTGSGIFGTLKQKLVRGAVRAAEWLNDDTTNSLLKVFKPLIAVKINDYLQTNDISATIEVARIMREGEKVKLTLNLDEIDYA